MKLRTWIALGLLVVGTAGCSADQELRELVREGSWIFGTVIPFDGNDLVVLYHSSESRDLAVLECDPHQRCKVLAVDPWAWGAPTRALFYPVEDELVFNVSNLVYHYRPKQELLTHFELSAGAGGVLYVIDGVVHVEVGSHGVGASYDLGTGELVEQYRFEVRRVPPVLTSREEIDNYSILSHEITDETRAFYEKLLNLTPVDDFGRPIEE